MSFTNDEYQTAADALGVEIAAVKAVSAVEAGGVTMWTVDGKQRPPVRLEAAYFGKYTNYKYNSSDPDISSTEWNPALAAGTAKGAWDQVLKASNLDKVAAIKSTSWGAFQIMGDHYPDLGFATPEAFVDDNFTEAGQMDCFVRFIKSEPNLLRALKNKDWRSFASGYNGSGQVDVYAGKIENAYNHASDLPGVRYLHLGDTGDDVVELQKLLNTTADGIFGTGTEQLLVAFQGAHGLVADGIAGPATMKVLRG